MLIVDRSYRPGEPRSRLSALSARRLRPAALSIVCAATILVAGCADHGSKGLTAMPEDLPGLGSADLQVRRQTKGEVDWPKLNDGMAPRIFPASGPTSKSGVPADAPDVESGDRVLRSVSTLDNRTYQLNFEAADVAAVCQAILADILNVNYQLDQRVVGQINLSSSQPVPRAALVGLLETSLSSIGALLVKDAGLYRIVPATEGAGLRHLDYHPADEGYGTTVIPSKYLSGPALARLLETLGSRAGSVKVEPSANLVMIQGPAAERRAIVDAASMLDVDWVRSKSVAIVPVANTTPETIIGELNRILDTGEGGLSQKMVDLQPIARLNAVLAVSRRRDVLDQVVKWAARLDKVDAASTGIRVYRLQYAQAKTVAAMLNAAFGNRQTSTSGQADKDLLEPGGHGDIASAGKYGTGTTQTGGSSSQAILSTTSSTSATSSKTADAGTQKAPAEDASGATAGSGSAKIRITPDVADNALLIEASPENYRIAERTIREIDRMPRQVKIDVTVAEVTLTKELKYGVQYYLSKGMLSGILAGSSGTPLTATYPGLNLVFGSASNAQVVINLLSSVTDVKVLSSPALLVVDRQSATLQVGDQVPVLTSQATSTSSTTSVINSVEMKDTGIILNVTPRVNAGGIVSLDVDQQISSVSSSSSSSTSSSLTPTISQRRVQSTIAVGSGQTVVLAGLISERHNSTHYGIPGLDQVKFLDAAFSQSDRTILRTELVVFIRPQVIQTVVEAQQVSEEFRDRLQSIQRKNP
jgi:general secretion pathway protein D